MFLLWTNNSIHNNLSNNYSILILQIEARGALLKQLRDLQDLLTDSILTQDEHAKQKEKILAELNAL